MIIQEDYSGCFIENRHPGGKSLNKRPVRKLQLQKSRHQNQVGWWKMAGGGGNMHPPFGYVLKEEPREVAPSWAVQICTAGAAAGCSDVSAIAALPCPVLMISSQHHPMGRTWLCFCLGWLCPGCIDGICWGTGTLFCCPSVYWDLLPLPGVPARVQLLDPGTARVCISPRHRLECPRFLHQRLRVWDHVLLSSQVFSKTQVIIFILAFSFSCFQKTSSQQQNYPCLSTFWGLPRWC